MTATRWKALGLQILAVALLAGLWIWCNRPGGVSPLVLPDLGSTLTRVVHVAASGQFWSDLRITSTEIVAGFVLSSILGVLTGFIASRTVLRARVVEPILSWGYMTPFMLFYPLFLLWAGIGMESKILYSTASAFFPVAFNALRGFTAIDQRYTRAALAFGASDRQIDFTVKLPAALPMVIAGIRMGAALTVITTVLAEMLSSEAGLGYQLASASQTLRSDDAYAYIILLLVFTAILQIPIWLLSRLDRSNR